MAITVRIGKENNFKADKLLPGEPAASLDAPKFRIGIGSGKCLELATVEQLQEILNASGEEYQSFQEFVKYLRENPNAYDGIIAQLDALPKSYVALAGSEYQSLSQGADLHELTAGNYRISSTVASSILNTPVENIGISYVYVQDDGTIKNIVVRQRGSGRMWWQSYSGSWGQWIEYTRQVDIEDKTKLTQYTSFGDLGLTETASYEEIFNAMAYPSMAVLIKTTSVSQEETPIKPTAAGLLLITKQSIARSEWRFISAESSGSVREFIGSYDHNMVSKWTGWHEITFQEEIADKTRLTQYTSWSEVGVPVTSDYGTIVTAMENNSIALLPVNTTDNNPNHPTDYGLLEILKTNFGPATFTFTRPYSGDFHKWYGTYRENLGFSGWKQVAFL